jgi:excinuclease UvrABC nuclease subunit
VVADVRRVLEGDGDELDSRLQERQAAMVRALAFEQASRLQKQREALERAVRSVRRLRAARHAEAVLVYPAKRRGWVALWGVRGGRVAVEREVGREAFGEAAAGAFLADLDAAHPPKGPLAAGAIDEMLLVHSWIDLHRASPGVLDLRDLRTGRRPLDSAAAALVGRVRLCAAPETASPAGA